MGFRKYLFFVLIALLFYNTANAEAIDKNTIAGKYILETPDSGKDPRYNGKMYRFELTLGQDGKYELNTESPIVKYIKDVKTGIIHEKLSVYSSNDKGNYTIDGGLVILSNPDPILGKDLKFIDGDLYYKTMKVNKTSALAQLDIKIGMERSKVENMIAHALNTESKYSPYANNLKGGAVKYTDGYFTLEIRYKAGASSPLFKNEHGGVQGLPPKDETVESINCTKNEPQR